MNQQSSIHNASQLFKEVSSGTIKPVYYFFGTEDYRISEAVKFVLHKFLPDKQQMTNFQRVDARSTKCADLLTEMSTIPMLGDRKVTAVRDIQSYKPTELDRLFKMFSQPAPSQVYLLTTPAARMPKKNSAFLKRVMKVAYVVEFPKVSFQEAASMIKRKLAAESRQIDGEALNLLAGLVGGNRGVLEAECEKIIGYVPQDQLITIEHVREVAAGIESLSVFALADEILSGNSGEVLKHLRTLLATGNSPDMLMHIIEQHFLSLYLAKNNRPLPPARRWLAGRLKSQASRFDNGKLEQCIINAAETTAQLRKARLKPELLLEAFIIKTLVDVA